MDYDEQIQAYLLNQLNDDTRHFFRIDNFTGSIEFYGRVPNTDQVDWWYWGNVSEVWAAIQEEGSASP
jgi:hypothetical protein